MLMLLSNFSKGFMAPHVLHEAIADTRSQAKDLNIQNQEEILNQIEKICFGLRKQNPLCAMLDQGEFW